MLSVVSVCCDSLSANIRFTFVQCDSGISYSAVFCIYKADTLTICRVNKKGAPNLFDLQAERSLSLISTRWFVRYSVLGSHLFFSFLNSRTGDGGFTVTARSGGLLCFGAVSLESCFYRHIITYSPTHKLSFYGGEEYFFEEGVAEATPLPYCISRFLKNRMERSQERI